MNLLKTLSRRTILITTIASLVFFLVLVLLFRPIHGGLADLSFSNIISDKPTAKQEITYGLPVRLKIPKIKVDAAIDPMGITPKGEMEAPKGPRTVGWYKFGVPPGNIGSAVIDGHFGRWIDGEGSVFDNLHKLKKGDKLYVQDKKGATVTFVVQRLSTYDPNADATSIFRSNDGLAHLNLITCEGVWNKAQKSFSDRLILFADKEV